MPVLMALTPVTTPIALIAFVVAVAFYAYRFSLLQKRKTLARLPPQDRLAAVEAMLASFRVNTDGLSDVQKFELALAQIRARAHRFMIGSAVVCFLALLASVVSVITFLRADAAPATAPHRRVTDCLDSARKTVTTTEQMIAAARACQAEYGH